jgi:cytoskeleton protein RodZ
MSLGSHLRELRERRGLSLDELARSTRVARRYLEALEADEYASLPAPVFIRGFVRAYCQVLGAPAEEALALYAPSEPAAPPPPVPRHVPDAHAGAPSDRPVPLSELERRGRGPVLVSFVLLVVLGVALFAVTMALQSARESAGGRGDRVVAVAEPIVAETPLIDEPPSSPAAAPADTAPSPPAPPAVTPSPPPPRAPTPVAVTPPAAPVLPGSPSASPAPTHPAMVGAVTASYRLVARTTQTTWIRVRLQDGRTTEENMPAGEVREWVSNRPFILTVGNAGGVSLELNGRILPPLGASGEVIERLVLPPDGQ